MVPRRGDCSPPASIPSRTALITAALFAQDQCQPETKESAEVSIKGQEYNLKGFVTLLFKRTISEFEIAGLGVVVG